MGTLLGWIAYGVGRSLFASDRTGSGPVRQGTEADFRKDEVRFREDERRIEEAHRRDSRLR
jgi:hypothetical protein